MKRFIAGIVIGMVLAGGVAYAAQTGQEFITWTETARGYPPDKQEKATRTVLEQAEVLSEAWATA